MIQSHKHVVHLFAGNKLFCPGEGSIIPGTGGIEQNIAFQINDKKIPFYAGIIGGQEFLNLRYTVVRLDRPDIDFGDNVAEAVNEAVAP